MKVRNALAAIALAAGIGLVSHARAQSVTFDFQDGTDQGFGSGFGPDDSSKTFSIVNIGGSLRMEVPRSGAFQEAGRPSCRRCRRRASRSTSSRSRRASRSCRSR